MLLLKKYDRTVYQDEAKKIPRNAAGYFFTKTKMLLIQVV